MRRTVARRTLTLVLAAGATVAAPGCASNRGAASAPRGDRSVLTRAQLLATGHNNLYDAITALRSNWLRTRGVDSFATPTPVWVYYDETRLGGIETLRGIAPTTVTSVRYLDALAATARWGVGHGQGVILVSTSPR